MTDEKFSLLKSIYSFSKTKTLLCDESLKLVWSNDDALFNQLIDFNLMDYLGVQPKDLVDEKTFSISIGNLEYTIKIMPFFESGIVDGYLCSLDTLDMYNDLMKNREFIESVVSQCFNVRTNCFEVLNVATILYGIFERYEMYDEIKLLNKQMSSVYRLLSDVANQMEFVKYETRKHDKRVVEINSCTRDLLKSFNALIKNQNVFIVFKGCEDAFVGIDIDRYSMALLNIVVNSIQNTIEDVKVVEVTLKKVGDSVLINVIDKGVGITSDILPQIFTPFSVNCDNVLYSKTGLGLSIVKKFTETFEGKIFITSKRDSGTTVSISLKTRDANSDMVHLESKVSEYLTNKFSPLYLMASKIYEIRFF